MHPKVKGLEDQIQAYIDKHPDCEVVVELSRDVQHDGSSPVSEWFKWTIEVRHPPSSI